ncbi:hypothetical protein JL720_14707 [Aureococcus anophagefferens]|nr:hypothetical protein JL720_14707 [Aureococcus anophagefferens]
MATVTLYVSYAAPGGEAPEPGRRAATKTVRSVGKAVAKLVERKHGAAPAGLRLYAASGTPSTPSKAPPPSPRLDGLCVVAANQGLIVRAGRSLETALVGEVAFGAVVRVSGHVAGDGRAVAGGDLEGFGSSKCLAPLVDENDPLCVAFEHALAEPDGPQASVWVRHGGAEARADAVVAAARAAARRVGSGSRTRTRPSRASRRSTSILRAAQAAERAAAAAVRGAATDAELAEIALFAKLTRLPNLLLWPMDAADAAPGR